MQSLMSEEEEEEGEERKGNEGIGEERFGDSEKIPKQSSAKRREILVHIPTCQCSPFPLTNGHKKKKKKSPTREYNVTKRQKRQREILVQVPACPACCSQYP